MRINITALFTVALAATLLAPPASAKTLRSNVAFNTGIGKKTASQPMNGVQVAYQITLRAATWPEFAVCGQRVEIVK
jgi:hypothetical protein